MERGAVRLKTLALLGIAGVSGYFAFFGGEYSLPELRSMTRQAAALESRVLALRTEVDSLRRYAHRLEHDPATLERVARERYGMIRDGEVLYRFAERAALDTLGAAR